MPGPAPRRASSIVPKPDALYLVDGTNYVFRAYYALAKQSSPPYGGAPGAAAKARLSSSRGFPTGALLVFSNMLAKLVREHAPKRAVMVFDAPGPSFRASLFEHYKANRTAMPEDLRVQIPYFSRIVEGFGLPIVSLPGVEADDVIATLAHRAEQSGSEVVIWSGDKDLLQLLNDKITMVDALRDQMFGHAEVMEKYGVAPAKICDLFALMGDAIDNVPGVTGVGPGWARKLIVAHGDVEGVLQAAIRGEITGKVGDTLRDPHEQEKARLSRKLVELSVDVDGLPDLAALGRGELDKKALGELFGELEFGQLAERVGVVAVRPASVEGTGAAAQPAWRASGKVRVIKARAELDALAEELAKSERIFVKVFGDELGRGQGGLVGLAAYTTGTAAYVPMGHHGLDQNSQLDVKEVLAVLGPVLAAAKPLKQIFFHKVDTALLFAHGVILAGVEGDPMIAESLLDTSVAAEDIGQVVGRVLSSPEAVARGEVICGKGKQARPFSQVLIDEAAAYGACVVEATRKLSEVMAPRIETAGMKSLLEQVELPLAEVLARMEARGIEIDVDQLRDLSQQVSADLATLENEVEALAGDRINLQSPKQLADLLFGKLGLRVVRRTKTGPSTDAQVLEQLANDHPIAGKILDYRELSKLKSTYIETLPRLVDGKGRIHTTYNQAGAATGRISSTDPNLQNIPIRSELGRKIRRAFRAPQGRILLSADYSQIELRVLAHLSGDPLLSRAFEQDEDVHAHTAAEVFGVEPAAATSDMRRIAKAINYGLSYGQTDFGLAKTLRIPRDEAHTYIARYFERYSVLGKYMESLIKEARERGYVQTLLGRRRAMPELTSPNHTLRQQGERIARNAPIQGTAADILKMAMLAVETSLGQKQLGAEMLLTVHDELVFEVDADKVDAVAAEVRERMEQVMTLKVPLRVHVGHGATWADAHG